MSDACAYIVRTCDNDITDITEVCSNNEADIYLFADDDKLCRHIAHESDYELLQTALSKLQDWSETCSGCLPYFLE